MLDLSLSLTHFKSAGGSSYEAEAGAYFAAMSVQPDATRKGQLNTLIAALKTAGVYTKLDWLAIHAAHDEQAGRVNIKNPAQIATAVNTPTFATDRGFTGNGSSSYLNTNWNPTTATTPQYAQNSCNMGVWVGTDVISSTQYDIGNSYAKIDSRFTAATARYTAQHNSAQDPTGIATSVGHTMWVRTGSGAYEAFKNGVSAHTGTFASVALRNAPFLLCAYNSSSTGTATPADYSTRRIQASHWGSQLSGAEVVALYAALAAYMTAVGA